MKKLLSPVCLILVFVLLSSCTLGKNTAETSNEPPVSKYSQTSSVPEETQTTKVPIVAANDNVIASMKDTTNVTHSPVQNSQKESEIHGVWLAIYEIAPKGKSTGETEYQKKVDAMMENLEKISTTDIFVQVRANCDSIYPSEYFKVYSPFEKDGKILFDALKIIINSAHEHKIKIHAWINPYRISSTDGVSENDPIFKSVEKSDVYENNKKAYLKPSSERARKLVLNGIRELLNYEIDGVHIDDYFYPTNSEDIDKSEYTAYKNAGGTLTLADWRRANVNSLVSSIYSLVKSAQGNKIFSISPGGDINKNYNTLYADVELWCSTAGYADMIIPQIYFGFENETQPYKKCLDRWVSIKKSSSVKLVIGLAIYKSNQTDEYAGSGKDEWKNSDDIIKREVEYLRQKNCNGFALFSYHHIFSNSDTKKEVENLVRVM